MQTLDLTRTYTYEEYVEISARPEFDGRKVELLDGELIIEGGSDDVAGSSRINTILAMLLGAYLIAYVYPRRLGAVSGADGEHKYGPRTSLIPDVGFTRKERVGTPTGEGPFYKAPDLAIEVISASESLSNIRRKTAAYLGNGSRAVWRFYPEMRTVEVITLEADTNSQKTVTFGRADVLNGGEALPGFTLNLNELWAQVDAALSGE